MSIGQLALAAPPPLEAYSQLPTIDMVTLSSSGDRMAFVATENGVRKVFARQIDGPILMAAPVTEGNIRDILWAGENIVIIRISRTSEPTVEWNAYESSIVFALDIEQHKVIQEFGEQSLLSTRNVYAVYSPLKLQGQWYGFFAGYRCPTDCNWTLVKADLGTGRMTIADEGTAQTTGWVMNADGTVVARSAYNQKTGAWRVTPGGSLSVIVQGSDPLQDVSVVGQGRTPGVVALTGAEGDGFESLRELNLADGSRSPPLTVGREVVGLIDDPETKLLIGYRYADDTVHSVFFDPAQQLRADAALRAFPGSNANAQVVSAARDFHRMIVFTDGGDDSGTYWLVDLGAHKANVLGARYPHVTSAETARSSVFAYAAADGTRLQGILTLPPGRDPHQLPVVVLPHAGPEQRSRVGFDWWAQAIASRGYAVFQPNFRGSGGFGRGFRDAGFGEWGRKMQTDTSDGLAALAANGIVDAKRACIVGADYGGYVALAGVTVQQGLYRCAVSVGGIANLETMLLDAQGWTSANTSSVRYWRKFLGAESGSGALSALSPVKLAGRADAPILLIHGKNDANVPIEQSRAMERALRRAGKPVEFLAIEGEDHWLSGASARLQMLKAVTDFLAKNDPAT